MSACLRPALPYFPGLVPPMSEDIPRSLRGHQPQCAGGDIDRLLETGTNPGWSTSGKREVSLGPGLPNQRCTHSLPRSWVESCVVQLCEDRGFMDEG